MNPKRTAGMGMLGGLAGMALAAAGFGIAWQRMARRPLPKTSGTIELEGPEGLVRVRRDRWGVPHIEAGASDIWFAQGFCHAQDRSSDEKGEKVMARKMLAMTHDINEKFFAGKMEVKCFTCHKGASHPVSDAPAAAPPAQKN